MGRDASWWGAFQQQNPDSARALIARRVWEGNNLKAYMQEKENEEMAGLSAGRKKQSMRWKKRQKGE